MLAADKDTLVASLKQRALDLRQKELEYYVERYSNITTQASIVAGFAFDALVELDISPELHDALRENDRLWMESVYYSSCSITMALALYTVCVSSFATVYGHRLALQGPTGSVERAVAVMMKQRTQIFVTFGLSMFFLVIGAVAMAWIKMGVAAGIISGVWGVFFIVLVWKHQQMKSVFLIQQEHMVSGDVRLNAGPGIGGLVDISRLEAGFGHGQESSLQRNSNSINPSPTGYVPPFSGASSRSQPKSSLGCSAPSSDSTSGVFPRATSTPLLTN